LRSDHLLEVHRISTDIDRIAPTEEKLLAIQMQSLRKEDATWALAKLLTSLGRSPRCDATPEQFLGS